MRCKVCLKITENDDINIRSMVSELGPDYYSIMDLISCYVAQIILWFTYCTSHIENTFSFHKTFVNHVIWS